MRRAAFAVAILVASSLVGTAAGAGPAKDGARVACKVARAVPDGTQGTAQALQLDADRGSVEAMTALGVMYAQGLGVEKSACTARRLFRRAADLGFAPAMINLGVMHAVGDDTRRGGERAYAWLRAALYVGVADSERDATVFKLGMVAGRLDVVQVKRAEALARRLAEASVSRKVPAEEGGKREVAGSRILQKT